MDMTQDIGAGPYAVPYRRRPMTFKVDDKEYLKRERAIANTGGPVHGSYRQDELGSSRTHARHSLVWGR